MYVYSIVYFSDLVSEYIETYIQLYIIRITFLKPNMRLNAGIYILAKYFWLLLSGQMFASAR